MTNNNQPAAKQLLNDAWQKSKDPRIINTLVNMAEASSTEKTQLLQQWMAAQPENPTPHMLAAVDAQSNTDKSTSIKHYKKVLALQPNNVIALNNLAWTYFETNNAEASTLAALANKQAPNNPSILDTYGWIEVNMGNKTKGLKLLKQALSLDPTNKEIQQHIKAAKQ